MRGRVRRWMLPVLATLIVAGMALAQVPEKPKTPKTSVIMLGKTRWTAHEENDPRFADVKLSAQERKTLGHYIEQWFRGAGVYESWDADDLARDIANTGVGLHDLDGDGIPEVVLHFSGRICGAANCEMVVLKKTKLGYRELMESVGQIYTIQPEKSHGYRDIIVRMHGSATSSSAKVYRFSKGRYFRVECYDIDWEILDENDEVKKVDPPRVTRCK